jgi:hypothetical protein
LRIEAYIDHVFLEVLVCRQWKGQVILDLRERHLRRPRWDVDRHRIELGGDRPRLRTFLHERDTHRHANRAGRALRSDHQTAFDADLNGHGAAEDCALAGDLHNARLVAHIGWALARVLRPGACALTDIRAGAIVIRAHLRIRICVRIIRVGSCRTLLEKIANAHVSNGPHDVLDRAASGQKTDKHSRRPALHMQALPGSFTHTYPLPQYAHHNSETGAREPLEINRRSIWITARVFPP